MNAAHVSSVGPGLRVCASADVAEGAIVPVCVAGREPLAVYRVGGQVFVTQRDCTHGRASLADGWLEGFRISCPAHGGEFDVRDGRPLCFPVTEALRTFEAWEAEGAVFVEASDVQPVGSDT